MIKHWWTNNSWRFWAFEWVFAGEPYAAVTAWQEYRYMLNPEDERDLAELIVEEYERDVEQALRNPFVRIVFWVQCWLVGVAK